MTVKEQLQDNRMKYWDAKINDTMRIIGEQLLKYQAGEEFVSEFYNIKLFAKKKNSEKYTYPIEICLTINDEVVLDNPIACFKKDAGVVKYVEMLNNNLFVGECTVIGHVTSFSSREMKDGENKKIFEAKLSLE